MTALHWAAYRDDLEMAQMLIEAKANPEAETRVGAVTPLILAARNGSASMIDRPSEGGRGSEQSRFDGSDSPDVGGDLRQRRRGQGPHRWRRRLERPRENQRSDGADVRRLGGPRGGDPALDRPRRACRALLVRHAPRRADVRRRRSPHRAKEGRAVRRKLGHGRHDGAPVRGERRKPRRGPGSRRIRART